MSTFAKQVIYRFNSYENKIFLFETLEGEFLDENVSKYLKSSFESLINSFVKTIERDLLMSDPLPGSTINDHVKEFNVKFINNTVNFINIHVIGERPDHYVVNDGIPINKSLSAAPMKPVDLLKRWKNNPSRAIQSRDDPSGMDNFYGEYDSPSVDFCDQSAIGQQRHYDMFETKMYKLLNKSERPHEDTSFGVSTPAADARLLSRNIFKKNEDGVENGISRRAARLHNRYVDTDIAEGLHCIEKGYMMNGYDMSSLYHKVDQIKSRQRSGGQERARW